MQAALVRRRNEDWGAWTGRMCLNLSIPPLPESERLLRKMAAQYITLWSSTNNSGYELYSFYHWLEHHICDAKWPELVLGLIREFDTRTDS